MWQVLSSVSWTVLSLEKRPVWPLSICLLIFSTTVFCHRRAISELAEIRLVDILRRFVSRKSYRSIVRVFKRRTNCGYLSVYSEFPDGKVHRMHIVHDVFTVEYSLWFLVEKTNLCLTFIFLIVAINLRENPPFGCEIEELIKSGVGQFRFCELRIYVDRVIRKYKYSRSFTSKNIPYTRIIRRTIIYSMHGFEQPVCSKLVSCSISERREGCTRSCPRVSVKGTSIIPSANLAAAIPRLISVIFSDKPPARNAVAVH